MARKLPGLVRPQRPDQPRERTRIRGRLAVLLLVAAAACDCEPTVGAIDVVPPLVYVRPEGGSATTFRLEARLWTGRGANRKGIPETDGTPLEWASSKPWLKVKKSQGNTVTLELKTGYSDTDVEAVVTALAGGIASDPSGRVIVVTDAAARGNDTLRAKFAPDLIPNVAVVSGQRAGRSTTDCPESLFAFVRTTPLGQILDRCGTSPPPISNAAVLAVDHRMTLWMEDFGTLDDGAYAPGQGALRSLPIAVWVAMDGRYLEGGGPSLDSLRDVVRDQAQDDIREANVILAASRTGITLAALGAPQIVTIPAEIARIGGNCWDADAITSRTPGVLNIYYVEEFPGDDDTRGLACQRHEGRTHAVAYVTWKGHAPTTLVHEVGHILSLTLPGAGHTFDYDEAILPGFDITNVMTTGINDLDASGRDRFTVGQAFQMNVDSASWLNVATYEGGALVREASAHRLACKCPVAERSPCPRMGDDASTPGSLPPTYQDWMCHDEVLLGSSSVVGDAVGLLAGRRWRAPPGRCSPDLPGRPDGRWGDSRVWFENVARPGSCASWVAVFFKQHSPMYLTVDETPRGWLDLHDEIAVAEAPAEPWDVPVHIWYLTGVDADADGREDLHVLAVGDLAKANEAFGQGNRSGIKLAPTWHPVPAIQETSLCVPSATTVDAINAYYVPHLNFRTGSRDGRYCPPQGATDVIVVNTSVQKHSATAFGHYLGRALGLDSVKVEDQFAPEVLAGNLMRGQPADRGTKLTLGQVFRVHFQPTSWLNRSPDSPRLLSSLDTAEFPGCEGIHKNRCPAPGAVVP